MANIRIQYNGLIMTMIIIILLAACGQRGSQSTDTPTFDPDSLFQNIVVDKQLPSMAIGVVKDGNVIFEKAYGYADLEQRIPADKNTIYQLGSITKMFTGRLLAHLINEQKISLTDTLASFFPGTKFPTSPSGQVITVKDVATHSGEFPTEPANLDRIDPNPIKGYSKEQLLEGIEMMVMDTSIGSQFYYSNFGYGVLGTAMEHVAETPLSELFDTYILRPLEMNNTSLFYQERFNAKLATPYLDVAPIVKTEPWEMETLAGAGNMFGSLADMNLFLLELLTQDTINRIQQKSYFPIHDGWHYGLGCFVVDANDTSPRTVLHGSDIDGYAGSLAIFPEVNVGYVILTNWGEGDAVREGIISVEKVIKDALLNTDDQSDKR